MEKQPLRRGPVCTIGLAVWVEHMDVHRPVQGADQHGLVGALCLMSSVDRLCFPVGPVDVLLEQSHGKDVRDILRED